MEDGREIFDDDLDEESVREAARHDRMKGPRKRKREPEAGKPQQRGSITSMFSNMASKKKAEDKKIDDDNILGDLMSELLNDSDAGANKRKSAPRSNKFLSASKQQTA